MTVGAMGDPIFKISWWRPGDTDFNARGWMETRANAHGAASRTAGPVNSIFSDACLMPEVTASPENGSVWCGYAADADLAVELSVFRGRDLASRRDLLEHVVLGLSASGRGDSFMSRQVHSDVVAMDSQSMKTWLASTPFNDKGSRKMDAASQPVSIHLGPSKVNGVGLGGRKLLSCPLTWAHRRRSVSQGMRDPRNGRPR